MSSFRPGQMIGQYKVVSLLGKGGMATVYKGYQVEVDRFVAIKVLEHQFATDAEFIGRFRQEARLIARLEHPHILPVYSFGESDGLPYIAMRYLEAGTLSDRLKAGPLSLGEINKIFTQFAEALGYAHEMGVIHRDVKPSNAMLDAQGNLFLTDFGIAKLVEGTVHLTATGAITGTPAYMSPEQAMGQKVNVQADIFSLGIVLYEMLTGSTPFTAETPLAVLLKMVNEPLPPPRTLNPQLHPELEKVVLKALARNPDERYATMPQFLRAWRAAIQDITQNAGNQPTSSMRPAKEPKPYPVSRSVVPSKPGKSRRLSVWLIILPILLIVGVIGPYLLGVFNANSKNNLPSGANRTQPAIATEAPPESLFLNSLILPKIAPTQWSFWGNANDIRALNISGDYLLTSSAGGLTVWDLTNREHITLNMQSGLPDSQINTAWIDNDQSLYLGTDRGLLQVQNQQLNIFHSDAGSTAFNISAIIRDGNQLIIGTTDCREDGSGLWSFSGNSFELVRNFPSTVDDHPEKVSCSITSLYLDPDITLWAGTTKGLAHFDGLQWKVFSESDGLTDPFILHITQDASGRIIATTPSGLFSLNAGKFQVAVRASEIGLTSINDFVQDDSGKFWITSENGIIRYDPATRGMEKFNKESGQLPTNHFTSAAKDTSGVLYFGSDQGGFITTEGYNFDRLILTHTLANSSHDRILSSPDGSLWFVDHSSTVVDQLIPSADTWASFPAHETCCLIPFGFYTDGTLFGGGDTGAWFILGDTTIHLTTKEGLLSDRVTAINLFGNRRVLIGSDKGMQNLKGDEIIGTLIPTKYGLASDEVTALYVAPDQSTWMGLKGGMIHITTDNVIESYLAPNLFSNTLEAVTDFATDLQGRLWVTTLGDGIYSFENDAWQHYSPLEIEPIHSNRINCVTVAPDGGVWFGTEDAGAVLYHDRQWRAVDRNAGLQLDSIRDIVVDDQGSVWFTGAQGISKYQQ